MWSTALLRVVLAALAVAPAVHAEPGQLRLFHRVFHPLVPQAQFLERGSLQSTPGNQFSYSPSSLLARDLDSFAQTLADIAKAGFSPDTALYQVALEREGDATEANWDISGVKVVSLF